MDWSPVLLWIQWAVYVVLNVDCKLIMVALFLLVTTLKCCEVLFPLASNTAQKREDVNFQSKIKQSFFMFSKSTKKQRLAFFWFFFFIGSYVTTKVIALRLTELLYIINVTFQDLACFCTSDYNNTALGPSVAIWITLSPVFLFTYYIKSLPRGCGVILQGHLHLRMSQTLSTECISFKHVKILCKSLVTKN